MHLLGQDAQWLLDVGEQDLGHASQSNSIPDLHRMRWLAGAGSTEGGTIAVGSTMSRCQH